MCHSRESGNLFHLLDAHLCENDIKLPFDKWSKTQNIIIPHNTRKHQ